MLLASAGDLENFVFKSPRNPNKPMTYNATYHHVHEVMIRAGFTGKRLSPHTLRHSSASLVMLMSKGNISLVDSLLGHAQGSQASYVYLHDYQESLAQSVSPLQLVKDQFIINHPQQPKQNQLLLDTNIPTSENSTDLIITTEQQKYTDNTPDPFTELMFPKPPNTSVRPSFTYDEILLIRRAFIALSQFGQVTTDTKTAQALYARMLRKAKNKEQPPEPELQEQIYSRTIYDKIRR
jgi:hypothetical protein